MQALELRDGGDRYQGKGVQQAVANVVETIAPALEGLDARDQAQVDATMIALDGTPGGAAGGATGSAADTAAETATAWRILDQELAAFLRGPAEGGDTSPFEARRRRLEAARAEVLAEGPASAEDATRSLVERLLRDSEND